MKIPNHNKSWNLKIHSGVMKWNLETYNRSIFETTRKRDNYSIVHECKTNLVSVLKKLNCKISR